LASQGLGSIQRFADLMSRIPDLIAHLPSFGHDFQMGGAGALA